MELVKIIKYLEKKFPVKNASAWDHVGLQIFDPQKRIDPHVEIQKVFVCLDLNREALLKVLEQEANLIITRHPFIFEELKVEKKNPAKKEMIKTLISQKILVYSIHTNYDASPAQKMESLLAQTFNLKKTKRIGADQQGLKVKLKAKLKLGELQTKFETLFATNSVALKSHAWNSQSAVDEFYLVSGSGGATMNEESLANCVFITGEMKWNAWIYANDNQVAVLSLGHYMENYFTTHLGEMLKNAFTQLTVYPFTIQNQYQ